MYLLMSLPVSAPSHASDCLPQTPIFQPALGEVFLEELNMTEILRCGGNVVLVRQATFGGGAQSVSRLTTHTEQFLNQIRKDRLWRLKIEEGRMKYKQITLPSRNWPRDESESSSGCC
jgi:hypothetical protein